METVERRIGTGVRRGGNQKGRVIYVTTDGSTNRISESSVGTIEGLQVVEGPSTTEPL